MNVQRRSVLFFLLISSPAVLNAAQVPEPSPCRIDLAYPPILEYDNVSVEIQLSDCDGQPMRVSGKLTLKLDFLSQGDFHGEKKITAGSYRKDGVLEVHFPHAFKRKHLGGTSGLVSEMSFISRKGMVLKYDRPRILARVEGGTQTYQDVTSADVSRNQPSIVLSPAKQTVHAGAPVSVECRLMRGKKAVWRSEIDWDTVAKVGNEVFAFIVRDENDESLTAIYPKDVLQPLSEYRLLQMAPGANGIHSSLLPAPLRSDSSAVWKFDLLNGGGSEGWSGRFPGLKSKGTYRIKAVFSTGLFGRWSDGMRGRSFSDDVIVVVD